MARLHVSAVLGCAAMQTFRDLEADRSHGLPRRRPCAPQNPTQTVYAGWGAASARVSAEQCALAAGNKEASTCVFNRAM